MVPSVIWMDEPAYRRAAEEAKVPTSVMAYQTDSSSNVTASRPVYPYPAVARYTGYASSFPSHLLCLSECAQSRTRRARCQGPAV
ncbi:hypothetical protein F6X42_05695 [Paraburkholderia sp. WC7.3b]|uniref:Uncharacterized protein n=1 Tax=Paraburkholderia podalyriae TaxID=1938811 RepID=A0ABR7PIN4_9BURK|nr:hypothetical protein [Paraburkholderia podalyriae]